LDHATSLSRHRIAATAVITAAALAAAGCGTARPGTAQPDAGTPRTSVTAHPDAAAQSTPTSQPPLGAGQVGTLAQVPWAQIGQGWALVVYTTGNPATGSDIPGPVTLYMVDPEGGRYQIYQWPATTDPWSLIDWSGDKARALLYDPQKSPTTLHELTLATGQITTFTLPAASSQVVGYTRPDGKNILVAQNGIVRYSLSGVLQAHLIQAVNSGFLLALSSADGLTEVVNNGSGLALISNAGGVIRPLPVPGMQQYTCEPARWWNAADVLVSCTPNGMMTEQLWIVPVSGAAPTVLTPVRTVSGPDRADQDAWQFPTGTYVEAVGSCATTIIGKQLNDGTVQQLSVPGSSGGNVVIATSGSQMLVRGFGWCQGSAQYSTLVLFDPATGSVQQVLTPQPNSLGVVSAVAFNADGEEPYFAAGGFPR